MHDSNSSSQDIWHGQYKIPWNDPGFSSRMLAEHLNQDHELASRRFEWIDKQVDWIHTTLLEAKKSRILDLGCGPGFYSHRLSKLGHQCHGLDFGPATIEYARNNNPCPENCTFALADIRTSDYEGPYGLVMLLYGEFNVFSPSESAAILTKVRKSLSPGGMLIIEPQTPESVRKLGIADDNTTECGPGLFSSNPHSIHTEYAWYDDHQAFVQTFTVTDKITAQMDTYRSTTMAWSNADMVQLLTDAGFEKPTLRVDWPCNTQALQLLSANIR